MKHKEERTVSDDVARSSAFITLVQHMCGGAHRVSVRGQALIKGCAEKMAGYIELCYACAN